MNGLISLENMSLRPVSKEILELNEVSSKYGLVLTEEEARELSDTRNKSIVENDRVEIGTGAVTKDNRALLHVKIYYKRKLHLSPERADISVLLH